MSILFRGWQQREKKHSWRKCGESPTAHTTQDYVTWTADESSLIK